MFGKKSGGTAVAEAPVPSAGPKRPVPSLPHMLVEPAVREGYEAVVQTLGFEPTELVRVQLIEFMRGEGIDLYSYAEVQEWLSAKKVAAGQSHWCWRPLRPRDIVKKFRWGCDRWDQPNRDGYYTSADSACRPYDRLVPLHALSKVSRIESVFGDKVKFFVSDYATPDVDPFIMVRPANRDPGPPSEYHLVFDMWDEPGFGEPQQDA